MSDLESQSKRVLERYQAAVLAKDAEALIDLYTQDVRVFDAWGVWSHEGAPAWRKAVQRWFASLAGESVSVGAEDVRVAGAQDFAMVSAIVTYAGISATGERLRSMQNRLTWVLTRRGEAWKIAHEHTSAPVGVADFKAILRREQGS